MNTTVHLFSSSSISYELNSDVDYDFQTTCFPAYSGENSKGWCTIRRSGVDDNEQPQADSGWGFCSTDPSQEDCNGYISSVKDSTPHEVTFFDKEHCFEQLKFTINIYLDFQERILCLDCAFLSTLENLFRRHQTCLDLEVLLK